MKKNNSRKLKLLFLNSLAVLVIHTSVHSQTCTFLDRKFSWVNPSDYSKGISIAHIPKCVSGPVAPQNRLGCRGRFDIDLDKDVDLKDISMFLSSFKKEKYYDPSEYPNINNP